MSSNYGLLTRTPKLKRTGGNRQNRTHEAIWKWRRHFQCPGRIHNRHVETDPQTSDERAGTSHENDEASRLAQLLGSISMTSTPSRAVCTGA